VYGPVPSRRLGLSLGIDLTPHKVCDFDCVYCQCGQTTLNTIRCKAYLPVRTILRQVRAAVHGRVRIDFLTFSGSGEPTLNSGIAYLIREIKKFTGIPVCVITNGSILYEPGVRRAIRPADVNLPHARLKIGKIIKGLADFRREYSGQIWLEIMLVRGLNDSPRDILRLKRAVRRIRPDKIQLNTVVRPPSDRSARPVPRATLVKIKKILGKNCEIVAEFGKRRKFVTHAALGKDILEIIKRRPETASAIARSLGAEPDVVKKVLNGLKNDRRIRIVRHRNRAYYEPA
jgi:wyosine [tRNA(Phe)-imidazoG37] synthetase (radical SAM superfamily)